MKTMSIRFPFADSILTYEYGVYENGRLIGSVGRVVSGWMPVNKTRSFNSPIEAARWAYGPDVEYRTESPEETKLRDELQSS